MMKTIFKISTALLGLLLISAIILTFTLDSIVKSNIERVSSDLLDTEVTVESVRLSLLSGSGSISGIQIANPDGFDGETALRIKSVRTEMDPSLFLSDPVVVKLIEIEELELSYELTSRGSNLGTLAGNLPPQDETGTDGRQIVIDRLLMDNTRLEVRVPLEDMEPVQLTLDRFEQTNIGHEENNDLETTLQILFEVLLDEVESQARAKLVEEGGSRILDRIEDFFRDLF